MQSIPAYIALAAFAAALVGASVIDLRERRIPNSLIIAMIAIWFIWQAVEIVCATFMGVNVGESLKVPLFHLVAAVCFGAIFLLLTMVFEHALGKAAMGGGDIKLMFVVVLYIGWYKGLICLLIACIASIFLRLIIPHTRFARDDNSAVPFAPAIAIGVIAVSIAAWPL